MARDRTQKKLATRIDRTYFKRLHPWRKVRLALVFLASAAAIVFIALSSAGGKGELIQNPGHLTRAHASFENDCIKCHNGVDAEGKSTGKFSRAVSDTACLKCHDGAIHNVNQSTLVISDPHRTPPGERSSNCASCHTEHRGPEALVGANDMQCTQCHADLAGKTKKNALDGVAMHVTAFTLADHPKFGRELMVNNKLTDPTHLRFNHKKHMGVLKGEEQNCTWCHDPRQGADAGLTWENGKSPYVLNGNKGQIAPAALIEADANRHSLAQVNYTKNCKECHDLGTLPNSDIPIPHGQMMQVRQAILDYVTDRAAPWQKYAPDKPGAKEKPLNDRIASKLADHYDGMDALTAAIKASPLMSEVSVSDAMAQLPPDLVAKLQTAAGKLPANIVPAADKARILAAISSTTRPVDHLRPLVISKLRDEAGKGLSGDAKAKMLAKFDAAFGRFNQDTPDPRLFQVYAAFANDQGTSCIKCHDLAGDATAVPSEWSTMSMTTAEAPTSAPAAIETVPTGIPAGPRKWYVNSSFNHDSHRNMNCVECHAAALTSEATSDVLSPGMEWQGLAYKSDGSGQMVAATRSCVECHHTQNTEGPGAPANCTECHTFHDRSLERAPEPAPADVLSGKVFGPPAGQVASAGKP